jgi:hypothetical protein
MEKIKDCITKDFEIDGKFLFIKHDFNGDLESVIKNKDIKIVYFCNYTKKSICIRNFNAFSCDPDKNDNNYRKISIYKKEINITNNKIEELYLGQMFNNEIIKLPESLKILEIGGCFNKPLDNLPPNLKILVLGSQFNYSLENLPENLVCLALGFDFKHKLEYLPKNLKHLSLNNGPLFSIENLPLNLVSLSYYYHDFRKYKRMLKNSPRNLKILRVINNSSSIKTKLYNFSNKLHSVIVELKDVKEIIYLPSSVITCTFKYILIGRGKLFPKSIKNILLHKDVKKVFEKSHPIKKFSILKNMLQNKDVLQS